MKKSLRQIMSDAPDPRLEIKAPACPLCHVVMTREVRTPKSGRCYVFACNGQRTEKDRHKAIVIRVNDPFVDRWDAALKDEKVLCPNPRCPKAPHGEMRYFATRTGYMQALCPTSAGGCGAAVHNGNPDRKDEDKTYTPDERGPIQ